MKSELQPVPWKLHLAVLALALAFPFVFPSAFMLNFGVMALFYAFIGQSWNISGGFAGQLSFGHVAFFGVGAYASTIVQMRLGLSPWLGLPAAALSRSLRTMFSTSIIASSIWVPAPILPHTPTHKEASLLEKLDIDLQRRTGVRFFLAPNPLQSVVLGCGKVLESQGEYEEFLIRPA